MNPSSDPALHLPRAVPPGPKVRIEPRPVIKPQVEKDREAGIRSGSPSAPRFLRFQCPSCLGMLSAPLDAAYDGSPAPCPLCGTHVTAPRIAGGKEVANRSPRAVPARPRGEAFRSDRDRADSRFVEERFRPSEEG